jgi:type I restriction enzyme S subunit
MTGELKKLSLRETTLLIKRGISPKYIEEGILVLNQKCIRDQKTSFEPARRHDYKLRRVPEEKIIRKFDVLINSTGVGTLGRVAQVLDLSEPTTVDSHVTIVRPNPDVVIPGYFGFAVREREALITTLGEGSTGQTELSRDKIGNIVINIPSVSTQRAIAHILGTLDDKIELNRKMNETLEAIAQAIFKSWFVDFDPVKAKAEGRKPVGMPEEIAALFPDSFEDSELGRIPKGWRMVELGNIADVNWGDTSVTKKKYVPTGVIAFSASGADGFLPYFDHDRTGVVVSAIGANAGTTWLVFGKWSCIKNTLRFWSVERQISTEYLYFATLGKDRWPLRGSAQSFISQEDARRLKILYPMNSIAQNFGQQISFLYSRVANTKKQIISISELRDTLLPKLISGEIRIKDAEKFVSEIP